MTCVCVCVCEREMGALTDACACRGDCEACVLGMDVRFAAAINGGGGDVIVTASALSGLVCRCFAGTTSGSCDGARGAGAGAFVGFFVGVCAPVSAAVRLCSFLTG